MGKKGRSPFASVDDEVKGFVTENPQCGATIGIVEMKGKLVMLKMKQLAERGLSFLSEGVKPHKRTLMNRVEIAVNCCETSRREENGKDHSKV